MCSMSAPAKLFSCCPSSSSRRTQIPAARPAHRQRQLVVGPLLLSFFVASSATAAVGAGFVSVQTFQQKARRSMLLRRKHPALAARRNMNMKRRVELLDAEVALYKRGENPITTLTWFRGNFRQAAAALERRLDKVLRDNPWLGGELVKVAEGVAVGRRPGGGRGTKLYLEYAEVGGGSNHTNSKGLWARDFMTAVDDPSASPISRTTDPERLGRRCGRYVLAKSQKNGPFLKVSLVPCRLRPDRHFALIVSMSHLVADGHTYYRVLRMLCGDDAVAALIAERVTDSGKLQARAAGQDGNGGGNGGGRGAMDPGPAALLNLGLGFLRSRTVGPAGRGVYAVVDGRRMEEEKERAAADDDGVDFVSTNDVLTSWFVQGVNDRAVGAMALNWRNRLPGHTDLHAGNYENLIVYGRADSASPALIRKSLKTYRRAVTANDPVPPFWEVATTPFALVTNWASFAEPNEIEGCAEELHIPLYDPTSLVPADSSVLIIFRCGPGRKLGLYMVSSPDNLRNLGYGRQFSKRAPFLSTKPLL